MVNMCYFEYRMDNMNSNDFISYIAMAAKDGKTLAASFFGIMLFFIYKCYWRNDNTEKPYLSAVKNTISVGSITNNITLCLTKDGVERLEPLLHMFEGKTKVATNEYGEGLAANNAEVATNKNDHEGLAVRVPNNPVEDPCRDLNVGQTDSDSNLPQEVDLESGLKKKLAVRWW